MRKSSSRASESRKRTTKPNMPGLVRPVAHHHVLDAEATFDEAERRMSARMAREGAQKAADSWELHEKAIRKAEALARRQ
jgi:hypothetical protein